MGVRGLAGQGPAKNIFSYVVIYARIMLGRR
jgi:hypothetical protein